jgi:TRAP-type transport system periplasmic protein
MKTKMLMGLTILLLIVLLVSSITVGCSKSVTTTSSSTGTASTVATSSTPPASEVLKLKFSCDFQPFEPPGTNGMFFCDTLEKLSGGKIKVERFMGGQLGTAPEQFGLLKSGSVDISTFFADQFPAELPLQSILTYDNTNQEQILKKMNSLLFTIPETAALFEAEAAKQNIKFLNTHCIGETGILSRTVVTSLADLKGKKIGQFLMDRGYEALGLVHVTVQVPEQYEALSRGLIDCVSLPPGPMLGLKMYEVAKSYLNNGMYTAAIPIAVNLDMWNKLTPEMQKWFMEAAQADMENSIKVDTGFTEGAHKTFQDAGLVVGKLPKEDIDRYFKLLYQFNVEDTWMKDCAKAGAGEQAKVIKKYFDELTFGTGQ